MYDVNYHVHVQEEDGTRTVETVTLTVGATSEAAVRVFAGSLGSDYDLSSDEDAKDAEKEDK